MALLRTKILASIVFGGVCLGLGWSFFRELGARHAGAGIEARLRGTLAEAGSVGDLLVLGAVVEQEWDQLIIVPPYYSPKNELAGTMRIPLLVPLHTQVKSNEAVSMLCFLSRGELVAYCDVAQDIADFTDCWRPGGYSREKAVFVVDNIVRGVRRLRPRDQ